MEFNETNQVAVVSQKKEFSDATKFIFENAAVSISSLVLSIGFMVSYGYAALLLDPMIYFDVNFWNPVATIATLMNLGITSLIVYNAHINYKLRNLFLKVSIDNVEILYLMCLPILLVVIFTSFLSTILYIARPLCNGFGSAILSLSLCLYFVSVLCLLIETNGLIEFGENWTLNFTNYATVLLTITSLLGYTAMYIGAEQATIFINNIDVDFQNCTNGTDFAKRIDAAWTYLQPYEWKSTVLFGITCSIFLINPLLRHHSHLSRTKVHIPNMNLRDNITISPWGSLKLNLLVVFFVLVLLFGNILRTRSGTHMSEIIYIVISIVTYILLISATVVILFYVKSWDNLTGKPRTFNDILIWMTFCGILFHSLAMIVTSINQINGGPTIIFVITLVKYILLVLQITLQNLLEKSLLKKNWEKQMTNGLHLVLPLLLLLALCNGILSYANFTHAASPYIIPSSNQFFILFFVRGFDNLGEIFGTLQRLHGTVLFMYLYIFIRKELKNSIVVE